MGTSHLTELKKELRNLADATLSESFLACARRIDEIGIQIVFDVSRILHSSQPDLVFIATFESYLHSAATQIRAQVGRIELEPYNRKLIHICAENTDERADDMMEERMRTSSKENRSPIS